MRTASWMHSTLAIDGPRLGSDKVVGALATSHVGVGVVEGVHGRSRRDLDVKALACCHVADRKLHAVDLGVPQKENLVRPAQSLGQLSARPSPALPYRVGLAVVVCDSLCRAGRSLSHWTRSPCLPGESTSQPAPNSCEPSPLVWPGFVSSTKR